MFNKPIFPNFLHKEENENEAVASATATPLSEAKPPVNPMNISVKQEQPSEAETSMTTDVSATSSQPESFTPQPEQIQEDPLAAFRAKQSETSPSVVSSQSPENSSNTSQINNTDNSVLKESNLHDANFSDIWYTAEDIAYVRDPHTRFALIPIEAPDLSDFKRTLEQGYTGSSSYSIKFEGDYYRVERIITNEGVQFNCRKMPKDIPNIDELGFNPAIVRHLSTLSRASGLLLFAGPTGQGKTTSASAIMKRYLETDGGFLYTIEDPPEMPLSGLYHAKNGGLGLCKQTTVENNQWGMGLRSALRSKPRYILVGEIRTPETAAQCLVAATSGHLVFSTIHANGVEDALNAMIKYASSAGLDSSLAAEQLARGILGVIYQRLDGTEKLKLYYKTAFANPNSSAADQMRMTIRSNNINLATFMEQQETLMRKGLPMFRE